MRRLRLLFPAAALFLFLLFSCNDKKNASGNAKPDMNPVLPIEGIIVKSSAIDENIKVSGTLIPFENTELRTETSGRVVSLNVAEGKFVTKGTLLVKIFDGDLQAQLKKLQVQLQIAQKTFERQNELLKINGISQQEVDLTGLQVSNIQADIDIIKTSIAKTELRAPFDGRLGLRNISPGAYVTPQTLVSTISEINQQKIEFSIPEKYSSQLSNGKDLIFTVDGSPNTYKAVVSATQTAIEENTRNLKIRAVVKNVDRYLVPGTFAKVEMILGKNDNAIMIPSDAIIPQARNKQVILYKGGEAAFVNVVTGIRDSSNVQIISGVNAGDTVITTGLLFLKPGAQVKLSKIH
ncbi:MAG: efflux RND transporter periplasmic adaptor subunit [Sphingobacteriales bacterium]|nr:MAG: efflux RND transporter periplasmic adaptor subunit [Sphingobacteriales bacterium]